MFLTCISTGRRLILIDDIDNLAPSCNSSSSPSEFYSTSAFIHGIDMIVQKYNRENNIDKINNNSNSNDNNVSNNGNSSIKNSNSKKIFIVATCSDHNRINKSLLQPHRLGDVGKVIIMPFPGQKLRYSFLLHLLTCRGINIVWDIPEDETEEGSSVSSIGSGSGTNSYSSGSGSSSGDSSGSDKYQRNASSLALRLSQTTQVTVRRVSCSLYHSLFLIHTISHYFLP